MERSSERRGPNYPTRPAAAQPRLRAASRRLDSAIRDVARRIACGSAVELAAIRRGVELAAVERLRAAVELRPGVDIVRRVRLWLARVLRLLLLAGVGLFALDESGAWIPWALLFLAISATLAVVALRFRRFGLFALGAVAAYIALTRLAFEVLGDEFFGCLWFAGTSSGMIVLLFLVQRRFRAVAKEGHD